MEQWLITDIEELSDSIARRMGNLTLTQIQELTIDGNSSLKWEVEKAIRNTVIGIKKVEYDT